MNFKRILTAIDFSDCSNRALDLASQLASEMHARLYIVHVNGVLNIGDAAALGSTPTPYDAPWGHGRHEVRERLEHTLPTVPNVAYEHHYLTGPPAARIVELAKQEHVDLIVIGSHGRTGLSRLVMGSVAEGVIRDATCPVLVVKPTAAQVAPETAAATTGMGS